MGIGPTRPAWKAGILPLNYTRINRSDLSYLSIADLIIIPNTFKKVNTFFEKKYVLCKKFNIKLLFIDTSQHIA